MADALPEEAESSIRTQADTKANRGAARRLGRNVKLILRDAWVDLLVLILLGVAAIGVWSAPHAFTKLFPVTFYDSSADIVSPDYGYPYIAPPFSSAGVGLICALIPFCAILLFQLYLHSFTDAVNALLGLGYALLTGTLFQVTLKKTIGGLRPHFLSVCEPELPMNPWKAGAGYRNLMFTAEQVCRGDSAKILNAMESFPSGHAQISFAGLGYLAIYLFAHLKVQGHGQRQGRGASWGWVGMGMWRMPAVMAPILLATYISSTLVLSYNHHWYDVVVGGLIGIMMALFAYRSVFEGITDEKGNFVPRWKVVDEGDDTSIANGLTNHPSTGEHEAGTDARLPR